MDRTQHRPLPGGRMQLREAFWFALILSALGLAELAVGVNLVAFGVAFATIVIYALIYTPLKPRTSFSTVVGAIPGALPPMIGWAAGTGTISREAWVLCGIVFLWQMPHFLAIAWLYRDDYARAGFPLLPVVEPDGRSTASQVAAYASSLVPISLMPTLMGLTEPLYFVAALVLGLGFLIVSLRFARNRTDDRARVLFLASIIYLPALFALMVLTRRG
jgi:protoheme IX farnesyltransferase